MESPEVGRSPDLNALYTAPMEFSSEWRRPLEGLALERMPHLPADERARLVEVVGSARREVEDHVRSLYLARGNRWGREESREARRWMVNRFPWASPENIKRAVKQGVYYAHHDHA